MTSQMQRRREKTYGTNVTGRRLLLTPYPYVILLTSFAVCLAAQRPTFEQQMRDNQRRLEDIRRERSTVEQELERLRTQAHSIADEISNLERQRDATNRIVNELDRQIGGPWRPIDHMNVGPLLSQED